MKIDHKFLKTRIPDSDFSRPMVNYQLANLLLQFMRNKKAIGLAANQVGYKKRVFVMQINSETYQCFNPEVISYSTEVDYFVEGCLSFPTELLEVARPKTILVKYFDYKGTEIQTELSGLPARCFQHELDHLNGITMQQRHKENQNVSSKS